MSPSQGALLILLAIAWGSNFPIVKIGVVLMPPLWFTITRLVLGALTLFGILALVGRPLLPPRRAIFVVLSVGLLQMAAFLALVAIALQQVPAGRASVLAYTTPLWVAPGAAMLLREPLNGRRWLGLLLGIGGMLVLFNPLDFPWEDGRAVGGNALLLCAALAWSLAILLVRGHARPASPLEIVPWQLMVGALALLPLALWREGIPTIEWSLELALIVAYNGPIATGFCYWAALTLAQALPAVVSSLGFLAIPAVGVAVSTLALGEMLSPSLIGGMFLVLAGVAVVMSPHR